nr:NADH dehydrogenase subunit 5 [Cardiastethus sp.]
MYFLSGVLLSLISMIFFCFGFLFLNFNYVMFLDFELLSINSCSVMMTFLFDWMSLIFMSCVLMISSMVIFYSDSYMSEDINSIRFLYLVLMFILSMMMMIISPNLISILIGWDGLGLVSYGLVIYFQNYKSYNAGMLTLLTNRIGDVAILISISWMMNFGSWHYINYTFFWNLPMYYILLLLILASFTKSAQIPFSSWLPAAMAAPTPVSALVHSSTLVTAGVYLMIRFSNLFSMMNCELMVVLGMMTMFMSGVGANFEFDLKKIIALSTLSQLGLMMGILFMKFPIFSFFHLLTHAFFKALLFLCAGLIIHLMSNSQDIRHMGGIMNYIPWTCSCFCISNLSLCGFPFLAGFYSKDYVLESLSFSSLNFFIIFIFYISVGMTSMYTSRLLYYSLFSLSNMYSCQSYFENNIMIFPMFMLTMMSVISGSALGWLFFEFPSILLFPMLFKILPIVVVLFFWWLGYELCKLNYSSSLYSLSNYLIVWFLGSMWFMPKYSTYMINNLTLTMSTLYVKNMDGGWGEYLISNFLYSLSSYFSLKLSLFQFNNVKIFLIAFMIMFVLILV